NANANANTNANGNESEDKEPEYVRVDSQPLSSPKEVNQMKQAQFRERKEPTGNDNQNVNNNSTNATTTNSNNSNKHKKDKSTGVEAKENHNNETDENIKKKKISKWREGKRKEEDSSTTIKLYKYVLHIIGLIIQCIVLCGTGFKRTSEDNETKKNKEEGRKKHNEQVVDGEYETYLKRDVMSAKHLFDKYANVKSTEIEVTANSLQKKKKKI
ncbi:hypothetical protein RFI_36074, partial [Reticulomyxa filosa]